MAPATPLDVAVLVVLAGLGVIVGALAVAGVLVAWGLLASRHRTRR